MFFAISDIHGHYHQLHRWIAQLEHIESFASGKDTLILLGDYINRGKHSYRVLEFIQNLSCRSVGNIVVLRGNHEDDFLEFIDGEDAWLAADKDFMTVKTFLIPEELEHINNLARSGKVSDVCTYVRSCIKERHAPLLRWLRGLRYYYETEKQIFVHAGVDEEAGDTWKWGTADYFFVGKFPPTTGRFYKDIIAGHTSAKSVSGNPAHKGIYWDGQSHYFIDGGVDQGGRLLCLAYDEQTNRYYELLPAERLLPLLETGGRVYDELMPL